MWKWLALFICMTHLPIKGHDLFDVPVVPEPYIDLLDKKITRKINPSTKEVEFFFSSVEWPSEEEYLQGEAYYELFNALRFPWLKEKFCKDLSEEARRKKIIEFLIEGGARGHIHALYDLAETFKEGKRGFPKSKKLADCFHRATTKSKWQTYHISAYGPFRPIEEKKPRAVH